MSGFFSRFFSWFKAGAEEAFSTKAAAVPQLPAPVDDQPNAVMKYVNGKLQVTEYNKAFVDDLRQKHGDLCLDKTDEEVVQLFVDRETIKYEEPRLEVIHSGITEDGRIQMKLDWNQSFIRHLRENGIEAETDEEAVEKYLMAVQRNVAGDEQMIQLDPTEAFREMDEMYRVEMEEAAKQIEEAQKKTRRARRKQKKAEDK